MIRAEKGPQRGECKVSRLDFREDTHTRKGPQQARQGRGMGPCAPRQVRTGLRALSHPIREVQLRRDPKCCRDPVARHEMVELYVRCRLTQPLKIRLAFGSLTHNRIPPCWVGSLCAPNAGAQPLPRAGATEERTLEAVGCSALLDVMAHNRGVGRTLILCVRRKYRASNGVGFDLHLRS